MAKRFYWLQLKEDFFRQKEIKMLRKIAGGDTYSIIYLKMMLMSLKDEGKILYEGVGSNIAEEIALEIDEDIENVQITINYLMSKNLMVVSDFEGMMKDVPSLIGSETDSARRVRKHREIKEISIPTLQCNDDVTNGNTEIDIELEKELELDNKDTVEKLDDVPYQEIIEYLNTKTNSNYKHGTPKTRTLIKARYNEGFNIDDFKKVIDVKTNDWLGTDNEKYLRPITLFGTNFESYANQKDVANKPKYKNSKPVANTVDEIWSEL